MSHLETLKILPVNKTVVFYSPIEGKDVLVRTGSISDGSCFFHALLHAYSKDYVSMDQKGKMKLVKKLRASIARKVDKERWKSLSNGFIAKIPFQENVNTILSDFYTYISRGKDVRTKSVRNVIRNLIKEKKDLDVFKLVTEMVSLEEGFEKNILPSACDDSTVSDCKKTLLKSAVKYYIKQFNKLEGELDKKSIDFYIYKLKELINAVVEEAEQSAYSEYIESLHNSSIDVDTYTIGLISEKFKRDIYFIDSRTRMPYLDVSKQNIKKRKAIIVMWTGGCHYEIVGRLLPGNIVEREFEYKDPLIKCIHTYIYHQEKIPDEYPNLTQFLPKELRQKMGLDVSDSEIEKSDRSRHSDVEFFSSDIEHSSDQEKTGSDHN